jgi:hypothetical protein
VKWGGDEGGNFELSDKKIDGSSERRSGNH